MQGMERDNADIQERREEMKCKIDGCQNDAYAKGECRVHKYKAYQRTYHKTDKYKAYMKAYMKTDKWKAYQKAYRKTDKCKAYQRTYKKAIYADAMKYRKLRGAKE